MKKNNKFFIFFVILIILIVICVLVNSFLSMNVGIKGPNVSGIEKTENVKRFNVLLIGTDHIANLTDTLMLMNVDAKNGRINVTSIPRDTTIFYKNSRHKINECYNLDDKKLDLLFSEIKKLTGVPINYYVKINYLSFRNAIDTLGGVEIDVQRDMKYDDPGQNLHINIKKGKQILNGFNAEGYVRFRKNNNNTGYTGGDIDRINVQQDFMKELIKQKLKPQYITKAPELLDNLYKYVETNFVVKDILALLPTANKFDLQNAFNSITLEGNSEMLNQISYFVPDEEKIKKQLMDAFSTKIVDNPVTPKPESSSTSSSKKVSSK